MSEILSKPLALPCGADIPNRLCKAAMTEGLADAGNRATDAHATLYEAWAKGGVGLQITGNVQVDRRCLERPGNVVIDGELSNEALAQLTSFASAGKAGGGRIYMQISHAGRQTPASVNPNPLAPSAIPLKMPGGVFGEPVEMTGDQVRDVVDRFANACRIAKQTGFDGVQIHAAHGYLISQFLSPKSNRRSDEWGGSLENRARLLVETVRASRGAVGPDYPITVKLNSADFQSGGFTHEDCLAVVDLLNAEGVDLLEITGGNYEQPKMADVEGFEPVFEEQVRESTRAREAYFLGYASSVRERADMPVMATGGFRTVAAMEAAIADGEADMIGLARPLCAEPGLPSRLLSGAADAVPDWENKLRLGPTRWLGKNSPIGLIKALNGWGAQGWFCLQIQRIADGKEPDLGMGVLKAFQTYQKSEAKAAKAYLAAL